MNFISSRPLTMVVHRDTNSILGVGRQGELFTGAGKSSDPGRTLARQHAFLAPFVSLPFDDVAAHIYGAVRAQLEQAGTPIGPLDTQIAAIALANDCVLVTNNTAEFRRVPGLAVEDWEA